jgi:ferrous iron transport protein B
MAQHGVLSASQSVIALTVMTLFVPCVAQLLMMVKERGWRVALAIVAFVTPVAVLTGAGLHGVFRMFGISF